MKAATGLKIISNPKGIITLSKANFAVTFATLMFKIPKVIWNPGTAIWLSNANWPVVTGLALRSQPKSSITSGLTILASTKRPRRTWTCSVKAWFPCPKVCVRTPARSAKWFFMEILRLLLFTWWVLVSSFWSLSVFTIRALFLYYYTGFTVPVVFSKPVLRVILVVPVILVLPVLPDYGHRDWTGQIY